MTYDDRGVVWAVELSRFLVDAKNSGIFVLEGLPAGQAISVRRRTVTAFVGPAPRGPVSRPVVVGSLPEFQRRFGAGSAAFPLHDQLAAYFSNGGSEAVVVRVCASLRFKRIELPGNFGPLILEAVNPGPLEFLRASIDMDGLPRDETARFNLTLQRVESFDHPLVEEQETYRAVSVDPSDSEFVGDALLDSALAKLVAPAPLERPRARPTHNPYVHSGSEWQEVAEVSDYDLVGSQSQATGLFALNQVPAVDILCLVSGTERHAVGVVAQFAAARYCEQRNAMLLLDPPAEWTSLDAAARARRTSGFVSANAMTYFPRPNSPDGSPVSLIGALAGRLTADDEQLGIAGGYRRQHLTLIARAEPPFAMDTRAAEKLGLNSIVAAGPGFVRLEGLVTLAPRNACGGATSSLPLRRAQLRVLGSLARGTRWAAGQRNDAQTRAELRDQIDEFLLQLRDSGIVESAPAACVICDLELNRRCEGRFGEISFVVAFALPGAVVEAFRMTQRPGDTAITPFGWHAGVMLAG